MRQRNATVAVADAALNKMADEGELPDDENDEDQWLHGQFFST